MKQIVGLLSYLIIFLTACNQPNSVDVEIINTLNEKRQKEMIELELLDINKLLKNYDNQSFIILDNKLEQVPYQITYDNKVIFNLDIKANEKIICHIRKGIPQKYTIYTCGKLYPERFDDLAWENDIVGFRAYGPTLQQKGERAYGYDLFAKRGTTKPVLANMYAMETDEIAWSEINALREFDMEASERLRKSITYHTDKGYGMDCYAVGPTLGAGANALINDNEIIYPWCFKDYEILDNGPLRFTVKLRFTPTTIQGKQVTETRLIRLDAGSHFNRTLVSYENLTQPLPIVTGIVLHDKDGLMTWNDQKEFMTYQDPTTGPNQGRLFIGHVFTEKIKRISVSYFSEEESQRRNQAKGHLLAESTIEPNSTYEYYWGFGWSHSDIRTYDIWNVHVEDFINRLKHPLRLKMLSN